MQILLQAKGPLPIKVNFSNDDDAPTILQFSGSVYNQSGAAMIGFKVLVDGKPVGQSMIYSNAGLVHRATVTDYAKVNLGIGQHTLELDVANADSMTDSNDLFSVVQDAAD